jgi:hypothetical protein
MLYFGILGDLKGSVGSAVAILVVDPPVTTDWVPTLGYLGDEIRMRFTRECHRELFPENVG